MFSNLTTESIFYICDYNHDALRSWATAHLLTAWWGLSAHANALFQCDLKNKIEPRQWEKKKTEFRVCVDFITFASEETNSISFCLSFLWSLWNNHFGSHQPKKKQRIQKHYDEDVDRKLYRAIPNRSLDGIEWKRPNHGRTNGQQTQHYLKHFQMKWNVTNDIQSAVSVWINSRSRSF